MEKKKMNLQDLEQVSGGNAGAINRRRVANLQSGYLAMRTAPCYDPANEMKGCELYIGDYVQLKGSVITGTDNRAYVRVLAEKNGQTGFVNAAFLAV